MGSGIYYVLNDSYLLADLISLYFYHLLYDLATVPPSHPIPLGCLAKCQTPGHSEASLACRAAYKQARKKKKSREAASQQNT